MEYEILISAVQLCVEGTFTVNRLQWRTTLVQSDYEYKNAPDVTQREAGSSVQLLFLLLCSVFLKKLPHIYTPQETNRKSSLPEHKWLFHTGSVSIMCTPQVKLLSFLFCIPNEKHKITTNKECIEYESKSFTNFSVYLCLLHCFVRTYVFCRASSCL